MITPTQDSADWFKHMCQDLTVNMNLFTAQKTPLFIDMTVDEYSIYQLSIMAASIRNDIGTQG